MDLSVFSLSDLSSPPAIPVRCLARLIGCALHLYNYIIYLFCLSAILPDDGVAEKKCILYCILDQVGCRHGAPQVDRDRSALDRKGLELKYRMFCATVGRLLQNSRSWWSESIRIKNVGFPTPTAPQNRNSAPLLHFKYDVYIKSHRCSSQLRGLEVR